MEELRPDSPHDWADRHVERWRDQWTGIRFDDETEAITVRLDRIRRHLKQCTRRAVEVAGLQIHEYETLHHLIVRDTPGLAAPSALAADLGVSAAGMTGRLDVLERSGWVRRSPVAGDRRRVDIEVTEDGLAVWKRAMALRGQAEDELFGVLTDQDRTRLASLLKQLTLHIEGAG
ncbi:MarR family winged helix-turn-helix transcriptional regulator [Streptomyces sp. NPDC093586]|uniref:MarR family winged helix-turn-helix transcriptional regulator n=1 Tax=Streptomyces sp. NPDC093586 TaxID=3366042 RepID=UPI00381C3614